MQYHHIFFHSLIVEPQKAFLPNLPQNRHFETWMITVDEYVAILNSLYERNYVLVKMSDLLHGHVKLPEGKTPLVISYDDVNYYDYMKGYGFADKIVITEDDEIANHWINDDGSVSIHTYADGVAILESFIKEHPDFSYRNARGILAITGYEGILGYRNITENSEEVQYVVDTLKERGWEFACHSYGHKRDIFKDEGADEALLIEDTKRWLREVAPVVGNTEIYISPFGITTWLYPDFDRFLREAGFCYFCDVNNTRQFQEMNHCYYFPRINIDGFLFQHRNYEFECYYGELQSIIDTHRIKNYSLYAKNAQGLVQHAYVCLKMPTVYLWGGLGEFITEETIQDRRSMYPNVYTEEHCNNLRNHIGQQVRGFDCSGLIKNYVMGGIPHYEYDANFDLNSEMMLEQAEESGFIDSMPELPGICLYMPGHVGIYVGKQYVVESTSNPKFGNGVVKTKLSDREWTHWFYCPGIKYE